MANVTPAVPEAVPTTVTTCTSDDVLLNTSDDGVNEAMDENPVGVSVSVPPPGGTTRIETPN